MKKCKFCGAIEGTPGLRGKSIHINRDGLCGPCYTLITKISLQPDKVAEGEMNWFKEVCRFNAGNGGYVPRQNNKTGLPKAWFCSRCGTASEIDRDTSYTSMCTACANTARVGRSCNKGHRKERSDKGSKHSA